MDNVIRLAGVCARTTRLAGLAVGGLSLIGALAAAAAPPSARGPVTKINDTLSGVSADSPSDAWAVGGSGSFGGPSVTLHWNGTTWTRVSPPRPGKTSGFLDGVSAVSPSDAWAVGEAPGLRAGTGSTWVLHWDGTRWSRVTSPDPRGARESAILGVSAVSASDAWAVGQYDTRYAGPCHELVLHWNGTHWASVPVPGVPDGCLSAVSAVSASDAWAVGGVADTGKTLILHWNGTRWTQVPLAKSFRGFLLGVSAVSASDAWAVGDYGLAAKPLALHWNGTRWTRVAVPKAGGSALGSLSGVSDLSARDAWAVGRNPGGTLVLRWNGTRWAQVAAPSPKGTAELNGVSAVSSRDALAVGDTEVGDGPFVTVLLHWDGTRWIRT